VCHLQTTCEQLDIACYIQDGIVVHLGISQIQHVEQSLSLITASQFQRRHAVNTNHWYRWTTTDSICSKSDMVQNQYHDLF